MNESIYINRLKERLKQKPDSRLSLSLAEELRKQDRMEEAIAVLIDGIKKNPDFVSARLTLGRMYVSEQMFAEAKEEFLNVIGRGPSNVSAHKWLADACVKSGDEAGAIEEYKKVLEIIPFEKVATAALQLLGVDVSEENGKAVPAVPEIIAAVEELQPEPVFYVQEAGNNVVSPASEIITEAQEPVIDLQEEEIETASEEITESGPLELIPVISDLAQIEPEVVREERIVRARFSGRDKEAVVMQLNDFLMGVKIRFASGERSTAIVVQRLNRFQKKINAHFSHNIAIGPTQGRPADYA